MHSVTSYGIRLCTSSVHFLVYSTAAALQLHFVIFEVTEVCRKPTTCFQTGQPSSRFGTWKCDRKIVIRTSYSLFRSLMMPACHGIKLRPYVSLARALKQVPLRESTSTAYMGRNLERQD